jgi:hypothetical protein
VPLLSEIERRTPASRYPHQGRIEEYLHYTHT